MNTQSQLVKLEQENSQNQQQQSKHSYKFSILEKAQEAKRKAKLVQLRKKILKDKIEKKMKEGYAFGRWNFNQQKVYIKFLQQNPKRFDFYTKNRIKKFFSSMSELIPTRTVQQCRSHHQKFLNKFQTHEKIVQNLSNIIQEKDSECHYSNTQVKIECDKIAAENDEEAVYRCMKNIKIQQKEAQQYKTNKVQKIQQNKSYVEQNKLQNLKQENSCEQNSNEAA